MQRDRVHLSVHAAVCRRGDKPGKVVPRIAHQIVSQIGRVGEFERGELNGGIHRFHGRHNRVVELDVLGRQQVVGIVLVEYLPPCDVSTSRRLKVLAAPVEPSGIVIAHQVRAVLREGLQVRVVEDELHAAPIVAGDVEEGRRLADGEYGAVIAYPENGHHSRVEIVEIPVARLPGIGLHRNVVQGDRDAYMLRAQSVDGVPIWRQKVLLSPYVGLEYRAHEFLELAAHTRDRVHRVADGRDDSDLHRERLARCRSAVTGLNTHRVRPGGRSLARHERNGSRRAASRLDEPCLHAGRQFRGGQRDAVCIPRVSLNGHAHRSGRPVLRREHAGGGKRQRKVECLTATAFDWAAAGRTPGQQAGQHC